MCRSEVRDEQIRLPLRDFHVRETRADREPVVAIVACALGAGPSALTDRDLVAIGIEVAGLSAVLKIGRSGDDVDVSSCHRSIMDGLKVVDREAKRDSRDSLRVGLFPQGEVEVIG